MKSGRLDRRITIQRKSITINSYGEEIAAWSTLATVWAEKKENSGREAYTEAQYQGKADVTFRIRWSDTVKAVTVEDRVSFDGRTFDITAIREISRREGLELDAYARSETAVAS